MNEMRRVLALLLCAVMLVGILPVGALAAETETTAPSETVAEAKATEAAAAAVETTGTAAIETTAATTVATEDPYGIELIDEDPVNDKVDTDYLFVATDRHANTSVIGNIINNMESAIGGNELDYLALGGDMVGSGNDHPTYSSSTVLAEVTGATSSLDETNVDIVAGIHDMNVNDDAGIVLPYTKGGAQIYEGDNFYVYGVEEYCISEDSNESNWSAQAQKFVTWAESVKDTSKAIIVVSHYPLHSKRGDNLGAAYWHNALNDVATNDAGEVVRNVVFFHGHNHTVDGNEYVYGVGDSMDVEGAGSSEIFYTYATAGYLNQNSKATLVTITADTITLNKYTTSGSGTAMATITRVQQTTTPSESEPVEEEKTVSYMTISEGSGVAYVVGDAAVLYKMYVSYTDGTSSYATQDDCTLTVYDESGNVVTEADALATPGTYSADVTYLGVTCGTKLTFTVSASGDSSYDLLNLVINGAAVTADVQDVTEDETVAAAMASVEGVGEYVAYDIDAELAEGETATLSIPIPEDWDTDALTAYYITKEGTVSDETFEGTYADGYYTFTVTHFSTYAVGTPGEETVVDREPTSGTITDAVSGTKTVFALVDTMEAGEGPYLIVSTDAAGNAYALGQSTAGVAVTVKGSDSTVAVPYIETDSTAIQWNYLSNSRVQNVGNSSYLYVTRSWSNYSYVYTLSISSSNYRNWTAGDNTLTDNSYSSNLTCANGTWSVSTSSANVYFYKQIDVDVDSNGTYTINGNPATVSLVTTQDNNTVELGSTLTFTPSVTGSLPVDRDVSETADYTVESDPAGIISGISGNTVTFNTGVYGTALVKVSYTGTYDKQDSEESGTYTVTNYITVEAKAPYNDVEVYLTSDENTAIDTLPVKGVQNSTVRELTAALWQHAGGENPTELTTAQLTWEVVSDPSGIFDADAAFTANGTTANTATSTNSNVTLNFSGNGGIATIRVHYTDGSYEDVTVTAAVTTYYVPEDGTTDFPDYPDEGAVVIDKTATAVGDFNKTGIAQVELNMFGVPVNQAKPFDVVLMLDLSNSMQQSNRTTYLIDAAKAFVETICLNSDGSWNKLKHGISICSYNIDPENEYPANTTSSYADDMVDIESLTMVNDAIEAIEGLSRAGGTDYAEALEHAYEILKANKDPNREQYLIFMSDGAPTSYAYIADSQKLTTSKHTESTIATGVYTDGTTTYNAYLIDQGTSTGQGLELDTSTLKNYDEYYSWLMKQDGVDIHTVGLAITDTDNQQVIKNIASAESQAYLIDDGDSEALTNAFVNMAKGFMAAASNVSVNDLIADDYSMIFELPENVTEVPDGQEFFIEVVNYDLDENHDRTGVAHSLLRIYLENGTFKAYSGDVDDITTATKADFTAVETKYAAKGEGEKGYFNVSGSTYTYVADGSGTHNITAGVYSQGSGDSLILVTPYFTYIGDEQDLTWTTDQLSQEHQIAIRYFVYLEGSAGNLNSGDNDLIESATKAGVYETNVKATVTYTNHLGNECQKTFPVPQMTWSGAQVGVTFYLVNAKGEPINRSGQVVPLAAAAFVTETFYESVVWNTEKVDPLRANILAKDHLPEQYTLYDSDASYTVHVYKDADGATIHNFFVIDGSAEGSIDEVNGHPIQSDNTTQVYNTINGVKKNAYGGYSATMNKGATINYTILDENDVEQPATATVVENTGDSIDYSSTNVAFAVLWIPTLAEDTVVVDYGLPVAINVVQNDQLMNTVNSLGTVVTNTALEMNTGHTSSGSPIGCKAGTSYTNSTLNLENGDRVINYGGLLYYVQNDMEFDEPTEFYYDTQASFTQENLLIEGYMYSKVTVIPATTVYYEDSFTDGNGDNVMALTYYEDGTPYEGRDRADGKGWVTEGTTKANAVQGTDRPGADKYHLPGYDSDNVYGYDPVYNDSAQFSLGSAAKVNVSKGKYATVEFDFYGTGFDLVSMTDSTTGFIAVKVTAEDGTEYKHTVDTYYGYSYGLYDVTYESDGYNWFQVGDPVETTKTAPETKPDASSVTKGEHTYAEYAWKATPTSDAIYQVPVINVTDLPYGKYNVLVTATYSEWFDHVDGSADYNFYLDAVRIYDPIATTEIVTPDDPETENKDEQVTVGDIYVKDNEGYPKYKELRDILIDKNDYDAITAGGQTDGAIFIDDVSNTGHDKTYSITDYTNYGPNNELYLAAGQTVAFELDLSSYVKEDGTSKVADVQIGMKSANGTEVLATLGVDGVATNPATITSGTSSADRYYSIGSYVNKTGKTILSFTNSGEAGTLLSVTKLKITFKEKTVLASGTYTVSPRMAGAVLMMLNAEPEVEETPVVLPDAELEVSVNGKNLKVGNTVTVKVTTSDEVESLTVNGQEVTEYKQNKKTGKRTWTVKVTAEEAGDMDIAVTAYSAEGCELDTVTETVTVAQKNNGKVNKVVGQLLDKLFG